MSAKIRRKDMSYDQSFRHGTISSYLRRKCSCEVCRCAWVTIQRQREQHRVLRREVCIEILKPHLQGVDAEVLAEAIGVPVSRIRRVLNGGQWQGSFAHLRAMAKFFDVPLPEADVQQWSRRPGGV